MLLGKELTYKACCLTECQAAEGRESDMINSPRQHDPKKFFQNLEDHIKSKEEEFKKTPSPSFSNEMGSLVSGEFNKFRRFYPQIDQIVEKGKQAADTVVQSVRQEVKKDPWGFLIKAAIVSFGIGLVVGHHLYKAGDKK